MPTRLRFVLVATLLGTAACASAPTGPDVMALPGDGKTYEQFRADDARCRESAAADLQRTPPGAVPAQRRYDVAYMQCMYAGGHRIPVPGGGWRSAETPAPEIPAPPAGTPPPPPRPPAR